MKSFLDLHAAQSAMQLVEEVYAICKKLPKEELFGLTQQLKNAAASVVANIAEGYGRFSYPDKANRYTIARGECTEVVARLLIAERVNLLERKDINRGLEIAETTGKLLSGLIASCRKRASVPTP